MSVCGRTSCDSHVFSFIFGLLKPIDTQNQPTTSLKVPIMIIKNPCKLSHIEFLYSSICLAHFKCSFKIRGDLKSNLRQNFRRLFLFGGHLVKQILRLSQHQIGKHFKPFTGKIWTSLTWLKLRDVLLKVFKYPSSLLHKPTSVLDSITIQWHEACLSTQAYPKVEF